MNAFEDVDCFELLKSIGDEKIQQISETLSDSADLEGEYSGRYLISDPRDNEVEKLKNKIKELEDTINSNHHTYSNKIADMLKIHPEDIYTRIVRDEVRVEWN